MIAMITIGERNWRRELILLGLLSMEAIWLTAFFVTLVHSAPERQPVLTFGIVAMLLLLSTGLSRGLAHWQVAPRVHWVVMTASLLAAIAVVLGFRLLPVGDQAGGLRLGLGQALVALLIIAAWWRGNIWAHMDIASPNVVVVHFWMGLSVFFLIIILGEALLQGLSTPTPGAVAPAPTSGLIGWIPAYFMFSLVTISLARVEEVTQLPESTASAPRLRFWMAFIPGAAGLVVLAGLLLSLFFTGGGLAWVLGWIPPVLQGVGQLLQFVVHVLVLALGRLLSLVGPAFEWVVGLLPTEELRAVAQILLRNLKQFEEMAQNMEETRASGELAATAAKFVPVLTLLLLLLVAGRAVRRRTRRKKSLVPEQMGHVSTLLDDSGENLLQKGLEGLADALRGGLRYFYGLSVRRIYANVGRLAAQKGYPRALHQTPNEYLEQLSLAFPDRSADVRVITQAYVQAHYGAVPDSRDEVERLRAAWLRIKDSD
jgi:hypothetical protein